MKINIRTKCQEIIYERYHESLLPESDTFLINTFFDLSELNSDLSKKINDPKILYDALAKYNNFCISSILPYEKDSLKSIQMTNLRELVLQTINNYYKKSDNNIKQVLINVIDTLMIDAIRQYEKKYHKSLEYSNKSFKGIMEELFENYNIDDFVDSKPYVKNVPDKKILEDFYRILDAVNIDMEITITKQNYIAKPFNMWCIIKAKNIISWFLLYHLCTITKGDFEKIKILLANFEKNNDGESQYLCQIIKAINDKVQYLLMKMGQSSKILEGFDDERLDTNSDLSLRLKENKTIDDKQKKLENIKQIKDERNVLKLRSTRNQELLDNTYNNALNRIREEFNMMWGVRDIIPKFDYIASVVKFHQFYIDLTRHIFIGTMNGDSNDMSEVKKMKNKTHPFSFLYQCTILISEYEEDMILEYEQALFKGWILQAIISNYAPIDNIVLDMSGQEKEDLSFLLSNSDFTYYYPIVYLYLDGMVDLGRAKKMIHLLTPLLTPYTHINAKSFEKNFTNIAEKLKRLNILKILNTNLACF